MIGGLLGAASVVAAWLGGAPWWLLLPALALHLLGRAWATLLALPLTLALLDPAWAGGDVAAFAAGTLGALAVAARFTLQLPWPALPYAAAAVLGLAFLWPLLPPDGFWDASDVAARARTVVLALLALLLVSFTYLPRYRNPSRGAGATGARDDAR